MRDGLGCMLVAICLVVAGCTAPYTPRCSRRITVQQDVWGITYLREGVKYRGYWGGGLLRAVATDPEAADLARGYQYRYILGVVLLVGTTIVTGVALNQRETADDSTRLALGGGALVGWMATWGMFSSAENYRYAALNAFNDQIVEAECGR